MDRRQFLAASAAALAYAGRLYAAPRGTPRFLLVFLRGGYDCNGLLVPYASDFYRESRPHLAIEGATRLDADWALAPAVRDTIGPMYEAGEVAFVPFAGTDDLSRSHFETQDALEEGQPAGKLRADRSGFLARLAGLLRGVRPMAFTESVPIVFQGGEGVPNIALRGKVRPTFDARQAKILTEMYQGQELQAAVSEGLALQQDVARDLSRAGRGAVSARGFEAEAEPIARLMADEYRLGFVDVGGWDTHVGQGADKGTLANHLADLGRGLARFAATLGPEAWKETVVVVLSEFGRTFRENGNQGTDHGHGTVYWVLGGAVKGGRVAGRQVKVAPGILVQDRDYPVLNDYRAVLGGLFRRLWGLGGEQLDRVFPEARPADLGLL